MPEPVPAPVPDVIVRRARTRDVRRIRELVDEYAGTVLLAKETVTLYEAVPEFLVAEGCHEMQGFYFSAAIPPEAFREKLENEND